MYLPDLVDDRTGDRTKGVGVPHPSELEVTGMAVLKYNLNRLSLAVRDARKTMGEYERAFGWSGWRVNDYVEPFHHNTKAANDNTVITVSGSAIVSFCSNSGQNTNDSAANSDAFKLA